MTAPWPSPPPAHGPHEPNPLEQTRPDPPTGPVMGRYSRNAASLRRAGRPGEDAGGAAGAGRPSDQATIGAGEPPRQSGDQRTEPQPGRSDGASADRADDASDERAGRSRRRPRPGDRRFLEAMALAALLPALIGVRWLDDTRNIQERLERPEKPTVVAKGKVGTLAETRWLFVRRTVGPAPLNPQPDAAEVRMVVAIRPLTPAGAKAVGSSGMTYRLRDAEGRIWSATALPSSPPRAGATAMIVVRGVVPRVKAETVTLEVLPSAASHPKGPLPSLRFAS